MNKGDHLAGLVYPALESSRRLLCSNEIKFSNRKTYCQLRRLLTATSLPRLAVPCHS